MPTVSETAPDPLRYAVRLVRQCATEARKANDDRMELMLLRALDALRALDEKT